MQTVEIPENDVIAAEKNDVIDNARTQGDFFYETEMLKQIAGEEVGGVEVGEDSVLGSTEVESEDLALGGELEPEEEEVATKEAEEDGEQWDASGEEVLQQNDMLSSSQVDDALAEDVEESDALATDDDFEPEAISDDVSTEDDGDDLQEQLLRFSAAPVMTSRIPEDECDVTSDDLAMLSRITERTEESHTYSELDTHSQRPCDEFELRAESVEADCEDDNDLATDVSQIASEPHLPDVEASYEDQQTEDDVTFAEDTMYDVSETSLVTEVVETLPPTSWTNESPMHADTLTRVVEVESDVEEGRDTLEPSTPQQQVDVKDYVTNIMVEAAATVAASEVPLLQSDTLAAVDSTPPHLDQPPLSTTNDVTEPFRPLLT